MNKIRFRCGKAVPSYKVNGIANADAKETTPRIPALQTTWFNFHRGIFSFLGTFFNNILVKKA
jgi:hypothetical protein